MPRLIATDESGAVTEHEVRSGPMTIGRSSECTIPLSHSGVSRLHAIVENSRGGLQITDQGSANGTWLNGERVQKALLKDGDEFKIGGFRFRVSLKDEAAPAAKRPEAAEPKRPARRKREVLGGVKLSRKQQSVIKIVCAVISVLCIVGVVWLLSTWGSRRRTVQPRVIKFDPLAKPDDLFRKGRDLARRAAAAEDRGDTKEAVRLYTEAVEKMERAVDLQQKVADEHEGKGYGYIHKKTTQMNTQLMGARLQKFRLEQQLLRYGPAGGR